MKRYQVTLLDPHKQRVLSEAQAEAFFGKQEWPEYRAGYLPNVLVFETDDPLTPEWEHVDVL